MASSSLPINPARASGHAATEPHLYLEEILTRNEWQSVGTKLGLSRRELEVVQGIFIGKKVSTIAMDMKLSFGTVKTYVQRIYRKLQVSDQRELTLVVVRASSRWQGHADPIVRENAPERTGTDRG